MDDLLLADPGFDAKPISADVLRIDAAAVAREIADAIRDQVRRRLRRRGAVIGLSGGIDSSVTAALCVSALGPDKVLAVFMPEYDSDPAACASPAISPAGSASRAWSRISDRS
jgi:NAD+ synthase